MSTWSNWLPFNKFNIDLLAPTGFGVYAIGDGVDDIVYFGRAIGTGVSIRSRLQAHLQGGMMPKARTFAFLTCANGADIEANLLRDYQAKSGRLPAYNARIG